MCWNHARVVDFVRKTNRYDEGIAIIRILMTEISSYGTRWRVTIRMKPKIRGSSIINTVEMRFNLNQSD